MGVASEKGHTSTRLSNEAFEGLLAALDEGMPRAAEELLKRVPVWEREERADSTP